MVVGAVLQHIGKYHGEACNTPVLPTIIEPRLRDSLGSRSETGFVMRSVLTSTRLEYVVYRPYKEPRAR